MRIAFVGNQDNNAYRICLWVREQGLDAHLYLFNQEREIRSRPEQIDTALADGYPQWIRTYDDTGRASFLRASAAARRIEAEHDVVVTSGVTGLLAARQFRRRPVVHIALGSELGTYPLGLFRWGTSLAWRGAAWLLRRGLRHARKIITIGIYPEMRALRRLRLADKAVIWGNPEDPARNRARVDPDLRAELNERYGDCRRVFLWLNRLNFLQPQAARYKAPERFLSGFERLVRAGDNVRAVVGTHGDDVDAFRQLVRDRGLAEHVDYVPHLPYWKLLTYLSIDNAVVVAVPDVQRFPILGGVAREAFSVGAVVVAAQDEMLARLIFGQPYPALRADDEASCHEALAAATAMSDEEFAAQQRRSRAWADRALHYEPHITRLLHVLREVVYADRFR